MNPINNQLPSVDVASSQLVSHANSLSANAGKSEDELKDAFQDFVGQTFFAQLIKAARSSQKPSAYFHGGRAEEIFQGQLDQVLSENLSDSTGSTIADPMFELFKLGRAS